MATTEEIARAGLGLELEGGSQVIADLRTIYSLMAGIVSLSSSIPKNIGGTLGVPSGREAKQGFNEHVRDFQAMEKSKTKIQAEEQRTREKQERDHKQRLAREEAQRRKTGPVLGTDVQQEVSAIRRRRELKAQADAELARMDAKELARKERVAQQERRILDQSLSEQNRIRRQRLADARLSDPAYQSGALADRNRRVAEGSILNPYSQEGRAARARFQAVRNDPAAINDPVTIGYRNQLAREVRAYREYQRGQQALRSQQARDLATQYSNNPAMARSILAGEDIFGYNAQRRVFKRSRNDPAARGDAQTQQWRDDLALHLRASRIARDNFRPQLEQALAQDRAMDAKFVRDAELRASKASNLNTSQRRRDIRESATQRQFDTSQFGYRGFGRYEGQTRTIQSQARNEDLRRQYEADLRRTFLGSPKPAPAQLSEADQMRAFLASGGRDFSKFGAPPPPPPSSGGGGGRGRTPRGPQGAAALRDPQGLFNERGFFTSGEAVGRITRNILLYQAVAGATYGLGDYITKSIQAAKTTVEFANALRFATEQAGGNLGANERLADSLLAVGLSRQQGRAAVVEAARFAEERPQDTEALTRTVANIAASRGVGVDRTDELIEQLRRRESKFYKRIFGTTVESIYEQYAGGLVDQQTTSPIETPGLFIEQPGQETKIKSRAQAIRTYVENMKDAEKETAVFNYILSQSSRFEGEAAERANTLAGRLDKMAAAWLNSQEGLGLFLTDIKPLNDLLDALIGKMGAFDKLRGPTLQRTGLGGTVSDSDIQRYASESASSGRTRALNDINQYGGPVGLGLLGLGASALLGRKQAQEMYRLSNYNKVFDEYVTKFNGNMVAAQNEAVRASKDLRPGFARSVAQGLSRVTIGMTDSITSITQGGAISGRPGLGPRASYFQSTAQVRSARSNLGLNIDAYAPTLGPSRVGAQGSFSDLQARRTPTITEAQYNRLLGLQTGTGIAGGILGAVGGATLGAIVAEKLEVGPITATGMTILGGVAGDAVGSALGQTIGASLVAYIAGKGGIMALITGGLGSALGAGAGGVSAAGAGIIGGVAAGGLALGGGIGALINYANPYDALSIEENERLKSEARSVAYRAQQQELTRANQERRVRYRDLRPGSSTFNQLLSEREARDLDADAFVKGFGSDRRGFSREILGRRDPALQVSSLNQVVARIEDIRKSYEELDLTSPIKNVVSTLGTGNIFEKFDARPLQKELTSAVSNAQQELSSLRESDPDNKAAIDEATAALNKLQSAQAEVNRLVSIEVQLREYGTTDTNRIELLDDYRARAAERERDRKDKEAKDRQDTINQQSNALSKLRNTAEGSFRLVQDTGSLVAGEDNRFVKVLSDQVTLGERMTRTWGHLGEAVVEYQKKLEGLAINRELNKLEFAAYNEAANFRGQAQRERDERNLAPGLSRADQDYLDIQSAIVDRAVELPKLWAQAAEVAGRFINPVNELRGRIRTLAIEAGLGAGPSTTIQTSGIIQGRTVTPTGISAGYFEPTGPIAGGRIEGFRAGVRQTIMPDGTVVTLDSGQPDDYAAYAQSQARLARLSPEARVAAGSQFADAALSIFSEFDPAQIRAAGLQNTFGQVLDLRAQGLDQRIVDARRKAEYNAVQDERLAQQLREDEQFRISQLSLGRDVTDVGRESDRLLLARTEGIPAKDLSYDIFTARQEALGREATRAVEEQDIARQGVERGLGLQADILANIALIREAIIGGDLSMLLQVQNDTQARLDQEDLAEAHNGRYNVNLDQGSTRTNPYSRVNERYGKGGIPKGKGGF